MSDLPAPRGEGWVRSVIRAIGAMFVGQPSEHRAGSDFAVDSAQFPDYDPIQAMSAYVAFPWVKACVQAIGEDLSGLPFVVRSRRGSKAERIDDHPVLGLLGQPSSRVTGSEFIEQWLVDLLLPGNAFAVMLAPRPSAPPVSLLRLHPARAKPVPAPDGQVKSYVFGDGQEREYAWESVLHVRRPSWSDNPSGLLGSGAAETLHRELVAERALQKRSAESAERGRPDAMIGPKATGQGGMAAVWSKTQVKEFKETIQEAMDDSHGGILVLGGQSELTPLSWSPKDMEMPQQRQLTREAILAVFSVPPTRLQLPTANYAQSTDAMTQYWMTLQKRSSNLCAAFTRMARRFPNSSTVEVYQDFSGVSYLQAERTARLGRVSTHILNGMKPADAYAYEGFDDAPIEDAAPEPAPPDPPAEDPAPPPERPQRGAMPTPRSEGQRAATWKAWERKLQRPAEAAFVRAVRRYLQGARGRVIARAEAALSGRKADGGLVLSDVQLEDLLARLLGIREESIQLRALLGPLVREQARRGFEVAARQAGADLAWGGEPAGRAESHIGQLVEGLQATTREALRAAIVRGLREGDTSAGLAQRIAGSDAAFGPSRAMTIARTESSRALSAGADEAILAAKRQGIAARKMWLSARDGTVRPSHRALDGQVVAAGGRFTVPAGVESAGSAAEFPGDFRSASLACNCRCTLIPVVE